MKKINIWDSLTVAFIKKNCKLESKNLILFISLCLTFCSENEFYEVKTYHSLSKPFTDTLFFPIKDEDLIINSLEMEISGYIDGEAILEIENGAGRYNKLKLKGELDEKILY
ncbi:MAG: hypothetical protein CVT96_07650 [Bacteroidetes bacterium HGW-Bacteroidetes-13]|nr:MAG: hypothetical protein CVT96_07650 [Bacteroidetes bacterium HGW-Bacteroidetes-13]